MRSSINSHMASLDYGEYTHTSTLPFLPALIRRGGSPDAAPLRAACQTKREKRNEKNKERPNIPPLSPGGPPSFRRVAFIARDSVRS